MAMICPRCGGSLYITAALTLPPDNRSDEIYLQVLDCRACGLAAVAVYEESRRGALDHEIWNHTGYLVDAPSILEMRRALESCPNPGEARCHCPAHSHFGQQDAGGSWIMPTDLVGSPAFEVKMIKQ